MNEKDIIEQSINEHQEAINRAKKKLSDLDKTKEKPELRHGDYGFASGAGSCPAMAVKLQGKSKMTAMIKYGVLENLRSPLTSDPDIILGNIFDDLSLYSTKSEEFRAKGQYGGNVIGVIRIPNPKNQIAIYFDNDNDARVNIHFDIATARQVSKAITHVICEIQREEARK